MQGVTGSRITRGRKSPAAHPRLTDTVDIGVLRNATPVFMCSVIDYACSDILATRVLTYWHVARVNDAAQ